MASTDPVPAEPDTGRPASAATPTIAAGAVSVVVGVLVLVWPDVSIVVLAWLFGVQLIVAGVLQLVAAFWRMHGQRHACCWTGRCLLDPRRAALPARAAADSGAARAARRGDVGPHRHHRHRARVRFGAWPRPRMGNCLWFPDRDRRSDRPHVSRRQHRRSDLAGGDRARRYRPGRPVPGNRDSRRRSSARGPDDRCSARTRRPPRRPNTPDTRLAGAGAAYVPDEVRWHVIWSTRARPNDVEPEGLNHREDRVYLTVVGDGGADDGLGRNLGHIDTCAKASRVLSDAQHDSLVIAGAWHVIAGIAALVHDDVYWPRRGTSTRSISPSGAGCTCCWASWRSSPGFAVLKGQMWARVVGIATAVRA